MNLKENTVIAITGTANVGKSMTLSRLGRIIRAHGGTTSANININEYRAVFEYHGIKLGLQTFGDHARFISAGLKLFKAEHCDIIVIACKKYGATVQEIYDFADANPYRVIWGSPLYRFGTPKQVEDIKEYTAQQLDRMIVDMIHGRL